MCTLPSHRWVFRRQMFASRRHTEKVFPLTERLGTVEDEPSYDSVSTEDSACMGVDSPMIGSPETEISCTLGNVVIPRSPQLSVEGFYEPYRPKREVEAPSILTRFLASLKNFFGAGCVVEEVAKKPEPRESGTLFYNVMITPPGKKAVSCAMCAKLIFVPARTVSAYCSDCKYNLEKSLNVENFFPRGV